MRTLNANHLTAQTTGKRKPYIYLPFTSKDGLTTYDYTSRNLEIVYDLFLTYNNARITLDNHDWGIADLRGCYIEIGFGDTYSTVNYKQDYPRMWVKDQSEIDSPNGLYVELYLEGMIEYLKAQPADHVGTKPYFRHTYEYSTRYEIIKAALEHAGFTLNALSENDGIVDTLINDFKVNAARVESLYDIIYAAISGTHSYLRFNNNLTVDVIYPQTDDAVDETYYSYQAPYSYYYKEKKAELEPNHFLVYGNQNLTDKTWDNILTGEYEDTTSTARYTDVTQHLIAAGLDNTGDLTDRAEAYALRTKSEEGSAVLVIQHDSRVELLDKPQIISTRGL